MCGRFTLATQPQRLAEAFAGFELPAGWLPRYNVAPSQPVAVIANNGQRRVDFFQWGLIPAWAKDPTTGIINARAETLAEKPSFKTAYRRRRCLILADGFYEWQAAPVKGAAKTPMYIRLISGEPFAFAGLWERRGDELLSCAIITTTPNSLMAQIHNRMPVILPPETYELWLDPAERRPDLFDPLLKPYPAKLMTAYPVSKLVNNPQNDSPACIEAVDRQS